jgi:hypothetical protein
MLQILWQSPATLFALAAVAAPVLIHILVQRRAETFAFPTLRFLQPTRLAAIRRHLLEDAALLAVRAGILAAAVAALAGPLVITPARRHEWDRRVVRAVVTDADAAPAVASDPAVHLSRDFRTASLADGIHRAVAWLETAPPARRELVVASRFPIGAITAADIASVPAGIGIRLERTGPLPATQTVDAGRVLSGNAVVARQATLDGPRTTVAETPAGRAEWPIEIVNAPAAQPAVDAAVAAVLAQRVWAPAPGRHARVVLGSDQRFISDPIAPTIATPWVADAIAHLARDGDLLAAAARVESESALANEPFVKAPWVVVATAKEGAALAAASESAGRLVVASAAPATDLFTPLLLRAVVNALAVPPEMQHADVVPIADRSLREWSRPPAPAAMPDRNTLRREDSDNDRRWLWLAALGLLAIEAWMRRARRTAGEIREDVERVA